jgi:hypothetical protein
MDFDRRADHSFSDLVTFTFMSLPPRLLLRSPRLSFAFTLCGFLLVILFHAGSFLHLSKSAFLPESITRSGREPAFSPYLCGKLRIPAKEISIPI